MASTHGVRWEPAASLQPRTLTNFSSLAASSELLGGGHPPR